MGKFSQDHKHRMGKAALLEKRIWGPAPSMREA